MSSGEILTSTGSLGLERRSFNRLYLNWRYGPVQNVRAVESWARRATAVTESDLPGDDAITRIVGRFLMDESVFMSLSTTSAAQCIEAVVPIEQLSGLHMVMMGINHASRQPIRSPDDMQVMMDSLEEPQSCPAQNVQRLRKDGFTFIDHIEDRHVDQILSLWSGTFGWSSGEVFALRHRLASERLKKRNDRSVWFSGIAHGEELVALSTAERLSMMVADNTRMNIIESTEWRTRPEWAGLGLGTAGVSHLTAQVVRDMNPEDPYVIVAETNFRSGAYRVGMGAGFRVPHRAYGELTVPQLLIQNVAVGDGLSPDGLRDFVMMYLPEHVRQEQYGVRPRQEILERSVV